MHTRKRSAANDECNVRQRVDHGAVDDVLAADKGFSADGDVDLPHFLHRAGQQRRACGNETGCEGRVEIIVTPPLPDWRW